MMEKRRWLFYCTLTMIFLIGLKEHMGVVLIGFGCLEYSQRDYSSGFILARNWFNLVTYLMIFQVMPYFRDYQAFINTQIAPFHDLPGKQFILLNFFGRCAFCL